MFLVHNGIVLIEHNHCAGEHAGERAVDNLHTVVFAKARVPNGGQSR